MSAPTAADRERWAAEHVAVVHEHIGGRVTERCRLCGPPWPCPVRRLLDENAALREALTLLATEAETMLDLCTSEQHGWDAVAEQTGPLDVALQAAQKVLAPDAPASGEPGGGAT
jgi:hypothetical protein